jgi:hypothetical protein
MGGVCSTYGERRGVYRILVGDLWERENMEDQGVDGRIVLKWIIRKWDVGLGLNPSSSG